MEDLNTENIKSRARKDKDNMKVCLQEYIQLYVIESFCSRKDAFQLLWLLSVEYALDQLQIIFTLEVAFLAQINHHQ